MIQHNLKIEISKVYTTLGCKEIRIKNRSLCNNLNSRNWKGKMKEGIDWNLRISGIERYLSDIYLMFLSWGNWHKACQNYTNKYICKIYVRFTWPELHPMAVQYNGHVIQKETRDNNTALSLVGVLVTWSGRISNIINYIY